ncbi:MAG: hypothetical protein KGH81_08095, partial [Thaumarchaeota archaeon]|nr:hypothetical protein [Nitrososphaerota archaeon]
SGSGAPTRWDTSAYTFVNVDGNNPIYDKSSGSTFGSSTTGTGAVSLNAQKNNAFIDVAATVGSRTISVGSGQTALYTATTNNNLRSVASDKITSSTTTDSMSTTWSGGSMNYAYSVIELQAPDASALNETVTAHDVVTATKTGKATLSETVTASDSLIHSAAIKTTLTEIITAHDAVTAGRSISQSLTDSPIAQDTLLISAGHSAQVTSILIDNTKTTTGTGTS